MLDSRYLSYLLRHHPEEKNLHLDKYGWCNVDELVNNLEITKEELDTVVTNNTRYVYNEDKTKIKAAHGHSIKVEYEDNSVPPFILFHGTSKSNYDSILKTGLLRMNRQAIHLSEKIEDAERVGLRHCKNKKDLIILKISAKEMYNDKYKFHKSEDNVWLIEDTIPPKYISI